MKGGVRAGLMIGAMVVSWSAYYALSKVMVGATGSALLAGFLLRLFAFVFLTVQLAAEGILPELLRQGRATLILILIGTVGFLLDLFANLGYAGGSLSTGTALLKTDVLMVNFATVLIYKKKLYPSDWAGTLVMLAGVLLVLGVDIHEMSLHVTDLFFILSALCVTVNAFLIKAAQEKYRVGADIIAYYNNFVVLALFCAGALAAGDFRASSFGTVPGFWWLAALGGLAQTGLYFFYYRNLKKYEVWVVKLYLLLMPVVSCFIGMAFLDEVLTVKKLAGIAVVLSGAAVILLRGRINREGAAERPAHGG